MDISPSDDEQSPGDVQAMDTNQIVVLYFLRDHSSQLPQLSLVKQQPCKIQNSQHVNRVVGENVITSLHGQPITLYCHLKTFDRG